MPNTVLAALHSPTFTLHVRTVGTMHVVEKKRRSYIFTLILQQRLDFTRRAPRSGTSGFMLGCGY